MRLPRFRFAIRRMMAGVAIVAVLIVVSMEVTRPLRGQQRPCRIASNYRIEGHKCDDVYPSSA